MSRVRLMLTSALPALLLVGVLLLLAHLAGAYWPHSWHVEPRALSEAELEVLRNGGHRRPGWEDFFLFTLGAMFLIIKSTMMLQRMGRPVDKLTVALVSVNFMFACLYTFVVARALFPYWFATNLRLGEGIETALRYTLIAALIWSTWVLTNTPPGSGYVVVREDEDVQGDRQTAWSATDDRQPRRPVVQ